MAKDPRSMSPKELERYALSLSSSQRDVSRLHKLGYPTKSGTYGAIRRARKEYERRNKG